MAETFRVYRSLEEVPPDFGPSALTIGNFDGVHAGHRKIMRRAAALGKARGWKPSVLTFDPHPARVVAPERAPRLMTSPEQRVGMMRHEGIRQVLILPFDAEFARIAPEHFVERILVDKLKAKAVLVGDNFRFGHRHAGDVRMLERLGEQLGFATEVVPAVTLRGRPVSSSAIRHAIEKGQVAKAARMLEAPFGLEGNVVRGHGVGSRQTVPTLNLDTPSQVLPATGVYITRTEDVENGRTWPSVTNIGFRPTFGGDSQRSIETFLLSPLEGPPPSRIRVEFLWRLREERRFDSPERLKAQILRDAGRARAYFRRLGKWTKREQLTY
ncbi:MAG: bifunctional riboflavin kinase/FAD synthetase [Bryobacteraceae bacterium]